MIAHCFTTVVYCLVEDVIIEVLSLVEQGTVCEGIKVL